MQEVKHSSGYTCCGLLVPNSPLGGAVLPSSSPGTANQPCMELHGWLVPALAPTAWSSGDVKQALQPQLLPVPLHVGSGAGQAVLASA